jgi:hypothetical protein
MAVDGTAGTQPLLEAAGDPVSRDDCRRRALAYFVAAEEADDREKREALLDGGRKWLRLASRIQSGG